MPAGEINVFPGVFGRRPKTISAILARLAGMPRIFSQVHAPPDPTYLPGLIHEVSAMREGGLRLRAVADVASTMSDNLSLIITKRQGETEGAEALTLIPSDHGAR